MQSSQILDDTNKNAAAIILERFTAFKTKAQQLQDKDGELSYAIRKELAKEIYSYTGDALERYCDDLTPDEKGEIFKQYINSWSEAKCIMDIQETVYADKYKNARFGKYGSGYNKYVPMLADFNLTNCRLGNYFGPELILLEVNFKGADFSQTELPYSHFGNCNLSGIKTLRTNFNQCKFKKCNFDMADLKSTRFNETKFFDCNLQDADFSGAALSGAFVDKCNIYNTLFGEDEKYLNLHNCVRENKKFSTNAPIRLFDGKRPENNTDDKDATLQHDQMIPASPGKR